MQKIDSKYLFVKKIINMDDYIELWDSLTVSAQPERETAAAIFC